MGRIKFRGGYMV